MKNFAIKVSSVSKKFEVKREKFTSIKSILVEFFSEKKHASANNYLHVLQNIDFEIKVGEIVGIMGRNGAGKSTLLKLIAGIYQPTTGKIETQGNIAPLLDLGAGFHPELSGEENIYLNGAILGYGKKAIESAFQEIVNFSGLGEHLKRPIKNYSNGMLIRLGFSIATHLPAPILLIDEVLAVGDIEFQKKCTDKISSLNKDGKTVILITHDPSSVRLFCKRCIVFDRGGVIFDGDPSEGTQIYQGFV